MLELSIPGRGTYALLHLVLDVNGTLTLDGALLPEVTERLDRVRPLLAIHLLSADTFGRLDEIAARLRVPARRLEPGQSEPEEKLAYVRDLGSTSVVAIGNGANDAAMLAEAAVGIAVLGPEGLAGSALLAADVLAASVGAALDLLLHPQRLAATMRR